MASYYSGNSEIQGGDGLQTLVLMNPGYVNYSDHHQQPPHPPAGNFMFLNNHQHTSQPQQLVGIPLSSQPSNSLHSQHDITFMPRAPYTMYSPVELAAVRPQEVNGFQQGLSLTLSSQQPGFGTQAAGAPTVSSNAEGVVAGSTPSASGNSNGGNGSMQSVLLNSKYLKATHELLEEVVNVGKERVFKNSDQSTKNHSGGSQAQTSGDETNSKRVDGVELTSAERQEVQMKKAKLVNMLDEVEQRYRQYHKQMQIVICWFEQASGIGSAKAYTALALETISKQFRCLKEAIMGQIKSASRNLGEEEGGGSRLKFVDNQIRQQRALQQLGMIQNNAWRPQRGLPERSVSVLRAWLFEHFLHPYPKDSDKHMLAKQTGLTRSQVSNWFINARVRLWKPMVEEMYLEEIKEQERQRNGFDENKASKSEQSEENENSPSKQENSKSFSPENIAKRNFNNHPPPQSMSVSTTGINFQNHSGFTLSSQMEGITQFNAKKPRTNVDFMGNPTDFMGGLGGYPIGEIERYGDHQFQSSYSGNGVSLTLGLPNESIRGMELGEPNEFEPMNQQSSSHSTAIYETINIQNQKRFAAQPLPDFVT